MSKGSVKIIDKDRGYAAFVKKMQEAHGKPRVEVGILSGDAGRSYDKGVTVLDVAVWNEFGTSRIPARSFLRAWFDENEDRARKWLYVGAQRVLLGRMTWDQLLHQIGLKIVGEIQERIASSIPPPNAPSTIARKGSTTTLIDTGQLRSSVSYRVATGGK